jgi:hypothetical protein
MDSTVAGLVLDALHSGSRTLVDFLSQFQGQWTALATTPVPGGMFASQPPEKVRLKRLATEIAHTLKTKLTLSTKRALP